METTQVSRPATDSGSETKNLSKLSGESNALTWFEIPVTDMARARKFYETVLDIKLIEQKTEDDLDAMLLFPRLPDTIMGRSDMVSGALIKADRLQPAGNGTLIYLNANPSIDKAIERVITAGGKILLPKTNNPAGYVVVILDTEGNMMGLYAGA